MPTTIAVTAVRVSKYGDGPDEHRQPSVGHLSVENSMDVCWASCSGSHFHGVPAREMISAALSKKNLLILLCSYHLAVSSVQRVAPAMLPVRVYVHICEVPSIRAHTAPRVLLPGF